VSWAAEDKETSIQRQFVSLKAHRGGEFQAGSAKVAFNGTFVHFHRKNPVYH